MADELTDYEQLRENPSSFVSEIIGLSPFDYQQEFMDEDARRKVFVSGRQVGKSLTCSWLGLHHAVTNPMTMTLITAPSLRQSSNLFKTLRSEMTRAGVDDETWGVDRDTQTIVEFDNGSEIHCLPTGRTGDKIRGYSADMIIVDEAAFIADQIFEDVLQPMTFATGGDIVLASTPWGQSGFFYKAFTNESDWYSTQVASHENPLIDEADLESFREGKTRNQIQREVLGQFIEDGSAYFPSEVVRETMGGDPDKETDEVFLGADIAAAGADQTVFVLLDGKGNVFDIEPHDEMGVLEAARRIQALDNIYGFKQIVVDYTGLGHGTVEALEEESEINRRLEAVYLSIQKKQAVYQSLKSAMENGLIALPDDRTLRLQLEAIGYNKTKSGNLSIHAEGEFHDDYVDALALGAWALPSNAGGGKKRGARGSTSAVTLGDLRSGRDSNDSGSTPLKSDTTPSNASTSINARDSYRNNRSSSRNSRRRRRR